MSTKHAPRWIAGVEPPAELLKASGTEILGLECRQQPGCLCELVRAYSTEPGLRTELANLARMANGAGPVLWLGMGGSLASSYGGSVTLQDGGRAAFTVDAGEWLHYGIRTWDQAPLTVLLTASGESAELVELVRQASHRNLTLICNNPASLCWQLTSAHLPILAGPEYGNATKTYTNAAAAAIILAEEILGGDWRGGAARAIDAFAASLERAFALRSELEEFCRGAANTEIIGRGTAYGAAVMGALTIRELSGHRAAPHTGAGFRHGPNLDTDATHVAMIYALGRSTELGVRLAEECVRKGGKVVLVSEEERPRTDRIFPVRLDAVGEPWHALTAVTVAQALTLGMIERNGCRLPPRFQYGVMEQ